MNTRNYFMLIQFLLYSATTAIAADIHPNKSFVSHDKKSMWEGLFFGLNGGIGGTEISFRQLNSTYSPGYIPYNINPSSTFGSTSGSLQGGSGPQLGIQGGYNYIFDKRYLLGIESDFNYSDIGFQNQNKELGVSYVQNQTYSRTGIRKLDSKLTWFGTTRARLGYSLGSLLPFVTGGIAYGNIASSTNSNQVSSFPPNGNYSTLIDVNTNNSNVSSTSVGWATGAGAEYYLLNNISLKTEFIFMQFSGGGFNSKGLHLYNQDGGAPGNGVDYSVGKSAINNYYITRIGINYFPDVNRTVEAPITTVNNKTKEITDYDNQKWQGLYAGVFGSYSTGNLYQTSTKTLAIGSFFSGVDTISNNDINITSGALTGLQAGYNFIINEKFLAGIESDFAWSGIRTSSNSHTTNLDVSTRATNLVSLENSSNRLQWFGTTRLRAGYSFGRIMPYVTAGFAYGLSTLNNTFETGVFSSSYGNHSFLQPGWVIGTGIELPLIQNVTAKLEYMYSKLGAFDEHLVRYLWNTGVPSVNNSNTLYNQDLHQLRVGLNYHFNADEEKVVAKY